MRTSTLILAISLIILRMISSAGNTLLAQDNYYLKTFTTQNGLPHNSIKSIAQDQTGFLWIATWDGLSRYDGYEFKNYYHNPNDSTALPFFIIEKIALDKLNNLWVLPALLPPVIFNRSNETFSNIYKYQGIKDISDLTTDQNGNAWLAGRNGLEKFDYNQHRFKHLEIIDEQRKIFLSENSKPKISFDNKGNIWLFVESNKGYWIFKSSEIGNAHVKFETFQPIPANNLPTGIVFNVSNSYKVFETSKGIQWLFSNFGFLGINTGQKQFVECKKEPIAKDFIGASSFSWITREPNINFYDSKTGTTNSIPLNAGQGFSVSFFDNMNSLWYGTYQGSGEGSGLTNVIKTPNFFNHYFLDKNMNNSLNAYFAVLKTKQGEIWAAPRNLNFIYRLKTTGEIIKCNELDKSTWQVAAHPRAFLEDSTGIWIGYYRAMLMHFDPKKNKFSTKLFGQVDKNGQYTPRSVRGFEVDGKDLILNGDSKIYRFNPETNVLSTLLDDHPLSSIYCLKKDLNNNFWLGSRRSNLHRFDANKQEIKSYQLAKADYNVEDICFGDNNDIWAALLGGGLAHLDLKTGKTKILTTADGLSNNTAYSILKDKSGNLWISTNRSISRYNPKTKQFRIFGPSDGLKIEEFNADAAFQSPDGEMLFGGMGGVVGFYPDSLKESTGEHAVHPIVITNFKVSGIQRHFQKAVYEMDTVSLHKGEDNFQLNFACIDFKNGDKIKYRYQLIGEDEAITETDYRHRYLNYANLVPGDYQLVIEATNPNGEWSSITKMWIWIPPHYYQTFWFKLLVALFSLSIVSIFAAMYEKQLRLKASRKQAELKLENLRGQMNPHFIFNSLNSINYFISQNDRLSANRYIADFSRLIRSFLANLSKEFILFDSELETIKDYLQLEHLRFGDKFDYQITIPEGFETEQKLIFPGMIQPFIENAIWHGVRGLVGRKGTIAIRFLPGDKDRCICIVEDDGIGRILSEERKNIVPGKKSNGISIVTERLKIINQIRQKDFKLIIENLYPDREETGTRVTIDIPLKMDNRKL